MGLICTTGDWTRMCLSLVIIELASVNAREEGMRWLAGCKACVGVGVGSLRLCALSSGWRCCLTLPCSPRFGLDILHCRTDPQRLFCFFLFFSGR